MSTLQKYTNFIFNLRWRKTKNSCKIRPAYLFCDDRVLFFCRKKCVMHFTSGSIQDTFSFCLERKDKRAVLQRLKFVFHLPIFPVFSVLGRITQEGRSKSQYLTDRLNKNDLENNWVNPNNKRKWRVLSLWFKRKERLSHSKRWKSWRFV